MRKISRSSFELPPPGTYTAIIVTVADLGKQKRTVGDEISIRHQLGIAYELADEAGPDGAKLSVSETYTSSLHEKSKLADVVSAAFGKTPDEVDPADLLGNVLSITVDHRTDSQGRTWCNVISVGGLPPAAKKGVRTDTPLLTFDLDEPDPKVYANLPRLFQYKIERRIRSESEESAPVEAPKKDLNW
jgi:hypothetical protein